MQSIFIIWNLLLSLSENNVTFESIGGLKRWNHRKLWETALKTCHWCHVRSGLGSFETLALGSVSMFFIHYFFFHNKSHWTWLIVFFLFIFSEISLLNTQNILLCKVSVYQLMRSCAFFVCFLICVISFRSMFSYNFFLTFFQVGRNWNSWQSDIKEYSPTFWRIFTIEINFHSVTQTLSAQKPVTKRLLKVNSLKY